jgi:predicted esterase YcpF (UPF0227 family)
MGDELLDSPQTVQIYQNKANLITYAGGSHGFEHMQQALPVVEQVLFADTKQQAF